jgi:hypothetical protein
MDQLAFDATMMDAANISFDPRKSQIALSKIA